LVIAYEVGKSVYFNITNLCPCNCKFCLRNNGPGINPNESLWLEHEPTVDEVISVLENLDYPKYKEAVFCGYGEPTERLDILLKTAEFIKSLTIKPPIRLNTNGLSDLINNTKTAPKLAGLIDRVSISLNAPNAKMYNSMCLPMFGEKSFDSLIQFAKDCKQCIPEVKMTVVGSTLSAADISQCAELCNSLDISLRVR